MKIAHLVQDEKFPDSAYELFESIAPGVSDYILIADSLELNYLKQVKPIIIGFKESLSKRFITSLKTYDFVVLHGLSPIAQKIVWKADESVTFVWIGMGYDYYDLIYPDNDTLLKFETRAIRALLAPEPKENIYKKFKKISKVAAGLQPKTKKDLIKKIKYFAPVVCGEFEKVVKACPESQMQLVDWNYGLTAKLITSNAIPNKLTGNNVLLGNSASFTNNHAEILSFLAKNKNLLGAREIIVPLNYGHQGYKEYISCLGQKLLGEAFHPIENFMSFDAYMSLLTSCSTVIMNHKRQQAGGNIAAALFVGATVFLDEDNPFYKEYKDAGVHIFSIKELESEPIMINWKLSDFEKQKNKNMVCEMRSWETVKHKTEVLISTVAPLSKCQETSNG